jgi:hypothetical protein
MLHAVIIGNAGDHVQPEIGGTSKGVLQRQLERARDIGILRHFVDILALRCLYSPRQDQS